MFLNSKYNGVETVEFFFNLSDMKGPYVDC